MTILEPNVAAGDSEINVAADAVQQQAQVILGTPRLALRPTRSLSAARRMCAANWWTAVS
jgi:hypothetical protein